MRIGNIICIALVFLMMLLSVLEQAKITDLQDALAWFDVISLFLIM